VKRILLIALGLFALTSGTASAAVTPNPWLDPSRHFLHIAHQGGEDEAPSNTMYALKSSIREAHADMLEIDVHLTSDGQLVVLHDDTFTRTSCLPALCPGPDSSTEQTRPASQIRNMTLAEVQALDAGYWFRPNTYSHDYGQPDSAYPFRGIRTGAKAPPEGYTADDFRVPTLKEVLDEFPYTPINIEIKMPKSYDPPNPYDEDCGNGDGMPPGALCDDLDLTSPTTKALAALLNQTVRPVKKSEQKKFKRCVKQAKARKGAAASKGKCKKPKVRPRNDIIVVSFAQEPMVEFASLAPQVNRAPSLPSLYNHIILSEPLVPDPVAFQVPPNFGGILVPELLMGSYDAHSKGYAVHVWTDGDDDETVESYKHLIGLGIDGIMTTSPRFFNQYLCSVGMKHPDGTSRCKPHTKKKKKKKRKKKG
jgi:glycerophosphoryl diester phosphodiesterase